MHSRIYIGLSLSLILRLVLGNPPSCHYHLQKMQVFFTATSGSTKNLSSSCLQPEYCFYQATFGSIQINIFVYGLVHTDKAIIL